MEKIVGIPIVKKMADIPKRFHLMLQPKENAKPDESDFEFLIPSGQFWNELTLDDQSKIRQIVVEEGQDLDELLHQMRQMLPKNPRGHS